MALQWLDGWDHYVSPLQKWTTAAGGTTISTTYARLGGNGLRLSSNGTVMRILTPQPTWVLGVALNPNAANGSVSFVDSGTAQLTLNINSFYGLEVRRGAANGTVIASSASSALQFGVWAFVEFKATIHDTAGAYEVRVNGVTVISGTGADTQNTTNASANGISLTGPSDMWVDDLYLLDTTGTVNNDFLGDTRVNTIFPTGAGASTQFVPSTGTDNWALVDETPPNSDTDYVSSSTIGDLDLYTFSDLASLSGDVYAVQTAIFARKDDAGTRSIAPVVRTDGTNAVGDNFPLSVSYSYNFQQFDLNPVDDTPWDIATVNAAEFGVEVTE
jgi:hypothetical protein